MPLAATTPGGPRPMWSNPTTRGSGFHEATARRAASRCRPHPPMVSAKLARCAAKRRRSSAPRAGATVRKGGGEASASTKAHEEANACSMSQILGVGPRRAGLEARQPAFFFSALLGREGEAGWLRRRVRWHPPHCKGRGRRPPQCAHAPQAQTHTRWRARRRRSKLGEHVAVHGRAAMRDLHPCRPKRVEKCTPRRKRRVAMAGGLAGGLIRALQPDRGPSHSGAEQMFKKKTPKEPTGPRFASLRTATYTPTNNR